MPMLYNDAAHIGRAALNLCDRSALNSTFTLLVAAEMMHQDNMSAWAYPGGGGGGGGGGGAGDPSIFLNMGFCNGKICWTTPCPPSLPR